MSEQEPNVRIAAHVAATLQRVDGVLRAWVDAHLIEPRQIESLVDRDLAATKRVWLVTGHIGIEDASYRVVYDEGMDTYGLETTLADGRSWYMGPYGTFVEAVEAM